MDVTIYYTPGSEVAPGAIERATTPLESGWDRWRVAIDSDENHKWGVFLIKRAKTASDAREWKTLLTLLPCECASRDEYEAFLRRNVARVEVDGVVFWPQSPFEEITGPQNGSHGLRESRRICENQREENHGREDQGPRRGGARGPAGERPFPSEARRYDRH